MLHRLNGECRVDALVPARVPKAGGDDRRHRLFPSISATSSPEKSSQERLSCVPSISYQIWAKQSCDVRCAALNPRATSDSNRASAAATNCSTLSALIGPPSHHIVPVNSSRLPSAASAGRLTSHRAYGVR